MLICRKEKPRAGRFATDSSRTTFLKTGEDDGRAQEFISKSRLDALTYGVFAFAMTLLVVKFDLPEDFHPKSPAELISADPLDQRPNA